MKNIKDIFSYSARWDSVGLSCTYCQHCNKKNVEGDWPTNFLKCNLHNISLNIELREDGYLSGAWFCKAFTDNGAFPKAVEELSLIKNQLEENILYEACQKEYLCMTPFDELEKIEN